MNMATFDDLELEAEKRITDALGKYTVAAVTVGVAFACLLLACGVMLFLGGSLVVSLLVAASAVVMFWLVALLRTARGALKAGA
jgi:hypothetical protein